MCEMMRNIEKKKKKKVCGLRRKKDLNKKNLHKTFTEKNKALYMLSRFQRRI